MNEIVLVAVPLFALACYWNALYCGFAYDDVQAILASKDLRPEESSMFDILTNDFWGFPVADPASHKSYRPFTVLTFRWNYMIHRLEPFGFHVANNALHAVVSLLVSYLCMRLFRGTAWHNRRVAIALLSGLLFAAHPIHVDAVTGGVGRAELLSGVLFTASLLLHLSLSQQANTAILAKPGDFSWTVVLSVPWSYIGKFVLFLLLSTLGLFSKETAFTVIGVAISYDAVALVLAFWRGIHDEVHCVDSSASAKRKRRRCEMFSPAWLHVLAHTCLRWLFTGMWVFVILLLRVGLTKTNKPIIDPNYNYVANHPNRQARLFTYPFIHTMHYWLLVFPYYLSPDYSYMTIPMVMGPHDVRNLASLLTYSLMLVVLPAFLLLPHSRLAGSVRKALLVSLAVAIVPYIPVSNLMFVVGFEVAERVMYLSSIGYCVLLAAVLVAVRQRVKGSRVLHRAWWLVVGALVLSFAVRTLTRNYDWQSDKTLWTAAVKTVKRNAKAHFNYGNELMKEGNFTHGIRWYKKAEELMPGHYLYDVGLAHYKMGQVATAKKVFEECIKRKVPNLHKVHRGLGAVHINMVDRSTTVRRSQEEIFHLMSVAKYHFRSAFRLESRDIFSKLQQHMEGSVLLEEFRSFWKDWRKRAAALRAEVCEGAKSCPSRRSKDRRQRQRKARRLLAQAKKEMRVGVSKTLALLDECVQVWPYERECWSEGGIFMHTLAQSGGLPLLMLPRAMRWYETALLFFRHDSSFLADLAQLHVISGGGLSAFALLYHVALAEAKQQPSKYSLRVYNMLAIALRDLGHQLEARRVASVLSLIEKHESEMQPLSSVKAYGEDD